MGSVCEAIEETVDYLNAQRRKSRCDQGSPVPSVLRQNISMTCCPTTVKKIAVLDRTKEPGSVGRTAVSGCLQSVLRQPEQCSGDRRRHVTAWVPRTPPRRMIAAVYTNLEADQPKNGFTIGIVDDVTNLSLPLCKENRTPLRKAPPAASSGAWVPTVRLAQTRTAIKIIGDHTDMYAQAYFDYDSKKSGGVTMSHLRFGTYADQIHLFAGRSGFCRLPQAFLRISIRGSGRAETGRHLPAELRLDTVKSSMRNFLPI